MSSGVGLSALFVNYNTGLFAIAAVRSLLDEWRREGHDRDRLQIVVVDNNSQVDQSAYLAEIEELGAEVIRHDENAGYAKGMNLAFARTSGGPDDQVAILNPDIYFLPGSLGKMMGYLREHPDCGALDPRACMDPLGAFHLPRNLLPTVGEHVRVAIAQLHPALTRMYARRRRRFDIPWWTADGPVESNMLSGCCVFMHRRIAEELPTLMDERYPLYYEDTDLFRTLSDRGYSVVHHGGARILHHWSRSAGVGGEFEDEPTRRYHISQKAYFEKFSGPIGRLIVRATNAFMQKWPKDKLARPIHDLTPLGPVADPVVLRFPKSCRFVVELGVAQTFLLAGGIVGEGDHWACPPEAWDWLPRMRFYFRALDRDTGELLGGWWFDKDRDGRQNAMDASEVEALGDRLWGVVA